jgi:ABC-type multidrug transport system fused ATPase/permease subunit
MRELISLARQGLKQLTQKGRRVIVGYFITLIALASLDGFALYFVSKLFTSESMGTISDNSRESSAILLVAIVCLFILRSALSTLSSWVSLKELSKQEVEIGQKRLQALHQAPLETRLDLNESDFFTAIDRAPGSLVQGFLVSAVNICAEAVTGLVILGVVLAVQPTTAIVAFIYFVLIAIVQHKFLSTAQARAGETIFKNGNSTYELLADYFHMNKLLQISASKTFEIALRKQRSELALARARQTFITSLPRYFMESMLALGFLVVSGFTWLLEGEESVVPALAIFAVAGFRLLPIVNRIQGLVLNAIGFVPLAKQALTPIPPAVQKMSKISINRPANSRDVMEVRGVDFTYPSGSTPVLENINLVFIEGLQYAIVGPSGSGKTTLIDICLGLLTPQKGEVLWKFKESGGSFGYVPQDTHISSASIAGNVALEWDSSVVDLDKVKNALRVAHLEEYFNSKLEDEKLNENFNRMSGGQRQRLGLARALYRESKILVLDEATSSLDAITESKVMETVKSLRGNTTVIIVAHRLSTIKDADQVIYLEGGKVLGMGTFTELQRTLPQFEEQVRLGLLTA